MTNRVNFPGVGVSVLNLRTAVAVHPSRRRICGIAPGNDAQ
jgi:hypothetical protein